MKNQVWEIQDWAGNVMRYKNRKNKFKSFEDAEDFLSRFLGDSYDSDRGEYEIVRIK